MGTGYTRNDSSNNIADGNVINASDLDGEFDAIVTAFSTSGHTHDGTAAEGGAITVMGPVQDFVVSATEIKPKTTNTLDIGTSLLQFKDIYIDGTAYLDTVDIDAGAIDGTTIGGTTPAAITATTLNATGGGSLTGTWSSLGTVTTVDINGGTIDGATIGGSSAAAITGTTITGTSFVSSGDMTFGDNNKAIFGAGSDLQIYHDGVTNNSYISELNPGGSLFIDGSNIFLRSSGGEEFFKAVANAQVEIYYDDAIKLSTTSTGIDVTGTVTADGLTVDSANSTFNGAVGITSAAGAAISEGILIDYSTNLARFLTYDSSTGSEIAMYTQPVSGSTTQRIRINSGGDISFYDSTGTSQNLFWDASASRLGIGTTSPDVPLEISVAGSSITNVLKLTTTGSGTVPAMQFEGDDAGVQHIIARIRAQQDNSSNGGIVFETEGSGSVAERMRIDSSGNVGIGTNSPTGKLSVSDPTYLSSAATLGSSITLNSENTASWLGTRELISFESVGNGADHRTGTLSVKLKKGASDTTLTEYMQINAVSNYTTFSTAAAERMRLDASGNLLVGTTDSNPASNNDTGGIALRETGQVNVSRDNNPPLQLNRKTGDGDIAVFQKDGTTVGSIGSRSGVVSYIVLDPRTSVKGAALIGGSNGTTTGIINPGKNDGDIADAAIDLGSTGARFKDIHLSGTVNAATLSVDGGTIKLDGNYPVGTENVALGDTALDSITTGKWNVALGHAALTTATNSNQQTAIGRLALTTSNGSDNTAVGFNAANANTSGTSNTAIGAQALNSNTTASNLTAVGYQAGYSNTTGINLTAVGRQAAYSNTTGANNTAFGLNALYANTTGASNVSIGLQALDANTTGSSNTALGMDALGSNTTASNNTAVGYQAGYSSQTGANVTAVGKQALYSNTASDNDGFGLEVLYANTTGTNNAGFGQYALRANTTGSNNSGFGLYTLRLNTTGASNTALGSAALFSNTTASNLTAVGYQAGYSNTTGANSVYIGHQSGDAVTTANSNTFVGRASGGQTTTGGANTFIGEGSGSGNVSGTSNTFLGHDSGSLVTGSKNTILGKFNGNQGGLDIRTSSNNIVLSDGDGNPRVHINSNGIAQTFLIGTTNTYNNVFNYVNGGAFQSTYADLIPTGNLSGNCTYLVTVIANLGGYPYYADTTFLLRTVPSTNGSGATSPIEFLTSSHVNSAALKWSIRTTSAASSTNGIQGLLSGGPSLSATNGVTCYAQRIA